MMSSEVVLRAWSVDGNTEAEFFLADIWRMLVAISGRVGRYLSSLPAGLPGEYRAIVPGVPPVALRNEVGVHRAQWVPHDSDTGRVETSMVGVELLLGAVSGAS